MIHDSGLLLLATLYTEHWWIRQFIIFCTTTKLEYKWISHSCYREIVGGGRYLLLPQPFFVLPYITLSILLYSCAHCCLQSTCYYLYSQNSLKFSTSGDTDGIRMHRFIQPTILIDAHTIIIQFPVPLQLRCTI